MSAGEFEKQKMGAPKIDHDLESRIQFEVDRDFPSLTPAEKAAMVRSRLKIATPGDRPKAVKVDLGKDISRKIKDDLLE